jgi:hypothetical protein
MPVTVDTSLPLHDNRDTPWDGDAAAQAMAAACTSDDTLDATCMGQGFLWRDPDTDDTTMAAYKFPVADIFDGAKHIVWSGVTAAASYLERAEDIPAADIDRMRSALTTLYERFAKEFGDDSIVAPWESAAASAVAAAEEPVQPEPKTECGDGGCTCPCGDTPATDIPVYDPVIRASAADGTEWKPPREWFDAQEPAPLTITADGQVFGDLARFGQRHIGYAGADIYPPHDPDGLYRSFRQRTIITADGTKIAVGVLTMDTGHASMDVGSQAAVEHYDHTGAIVAAVNIGEDNAGGGRIWLAGALLPSITEDQKLRLMLSGVSGDWRQTRPRGPLELVAALAVNVPGFPVPAVEVADGRQLTMVAAGAVIPEKRDNVVNVELTDEFIDKFATRYAEVTEQRAASARKEQADAARLARARTASAVMRDCVRRSRARKAHSVLTSAVAARMAASVGDDDADSDPALVAQGRRNRFLDERGRNWVEQTGGLPEGIRAVADELILKGFSESHAIAVAVNVNKRWCWGAPDGLNFAGIQRVTPRTRARGCKNIAEWNLNRARARADN